MKDLLHEGFEFGLPEELVKGVSTIELNEVDQGNENYLDQPVCLPVFLSKSVFLDESNHSRSIPLFLHQEFVNHNSLAHSPIYHEHIAIRKGLDEKQFVVLQFQGKNVLERVLKEDNVSLVKLGDLRPGLEEQVYQLHQDLLLHCLVLL